MKITSVDVLLLKSAGAHITAYPLRPVICRINTDAGISGFGEAGISTGIGENAAFGMVKDMASLLIGHDPMNNEVITEDLRERCYGHISGGGAVVFAGISAIDTALMDIKGKALGVPVYQLLGGKHNDRLHCYASQVQLGWNGDWGPRGTAKEYAAICRRAMDDGFDTVKVNFFAFDRDRAPMARSRIRGPLRRDIYLLLEERLAAIREECGEDLGIIAEFLCQTDVTSVGCLDDILRKYNVLFTEEATATFNPELFGTLSRTTKTPLATGERIHTRWGFHQMLKQNAVSVIQPDISNCGGIWEAKKICDLAMIYDVRAQMHVCGSPISEAAALQVEAAISNFYIHELFFLSPLAETVAYGKYHYGAVNSYLEIPDLPGIGQELSETSIRDAVANVTVKGS